MGLFDGDNPIANAFSNSPATTVLTGGINLGVNQLDWSPSSGLGQAFNYLGTTGAAAGVGTLFGAGLPAQIGATLFGDPFGTNARNNAEQQAVTLRQQQVTLRDQLKAKISPMATGPEGNTIAADLLKQLNNLTNDTPFDFSTLGAINTKYEDLVAKIGAADQANKKLQADTLATQGIRSPYSQTVMGGF